MELGTKFFVPDNSTSKIVSRTQWKKYFADPQNIAFLFQVVIDFNVNFTSSVTYLSRCKA